MRAGRRQSQLVDEALGLLPEGPAPKADNASLGTFTGVAVEGSVGSTSLPTEGPTRRRRRNRASEEGPAPLQSQEVEADGPREKLGHPAAVKSGPDLPQAGRKLRASIDAIMLAMAGGATTPLQGEAVSGGRLGLPLSSDPVGPGLRRQVGQRKLRAAADALLAGQSARPGAQGAGATSSRPTHVQQGQGSATSSGLVVTGQGGTAAAAEPSPIPTWQVVPPRSLGLW